MRSPRLVRYRSFCFAVAFLVLSTQSVFSAPFRIVSVGDPVLRDIRAIVREAGKSLASYTPPLSSDEIQAALNDIDYDALSSPGRSAYDRIRKALGARPPLEDGLFGVDATPSVSAEASVRTNPEIEWTSASALFPAAFKLPLEFYFADSVYAAGDLQISRDPSFHSEDDSFFSTNIPFSGEEFDMNMPLRSFMSAGGPWWNFQLGRNRLSFGAGVTGNMAISDTPDYYDFARLSLFSPNFKYSLLVAQLPLTTSGLGTEYDGALAETTNRYLYYHRWDMRLYERVSIGIGEGCMVGNSPLELRFLNPLAMYHGFFAWKDYPSDDGELIGSLLSLDIDWAIAPGWAAYGQFVLNDYQTPYEKEKWPDAAHPNGLGYLGGIEWTTAAGPWLAECNFEAVYADPYLYVLSSPFASYIWMRKLSALSSKAPRYAWLGHSEGRDFALFALRARFSRFFERTSRALALTGTLSYKLQGEHGLEWDWASGAAPSSEIAPTGTPERKLSLGASIDYSFSEHISVSLRSTGMYIEDADHVSGKKESGAELSVAASYTW